MKSKHSYTVEMKTKRDYTVEREARREDTRNKRQERLMCAYLKHAHPAIYEEAYAYYNKLDAMYPGKRDLRKTTHFAVFKKEAGKSKKEAGKSKKPPAQGDNFILEIPLMCPETVATRTSQPSPSPSVAAPPLPSPPVPASPSPSPPVPASPSPSPPVPALPSPSPPVAASPFPLSPDVYKTLMAELENDPDLWRIFNDFPLQECDEDMNTLVGEDVIISDDISPLEVELEAY